MDTQEKEETPEQWLEQQFEHELCEHCGGDAPDHTVAQVDFGAYGGPYNLSFCKNPPPDEDD